MAVVVFDFLEEVEFFVETEVSFAFWADTGVDFGAVLSVGIWFDDTDLVAAFFVIESDLEELHGLPTTHGAVSEIQL